MTSTSTSADLHPLHYYTENDLRPLQTIKDVPVHKFYFYFYISVHVFSASPSAFLSSFCSATNFATMKMFGSLMNFILKFVEYISRLFKPRPFQSRTSVQPPPITINVVVDSSETGDTGNPFQPPADAAAAAEERRQESNNHTTTRVCQPPPNNGIHLHWRLLIITICFTAVGTALQALQTIKDVPVLESLQFHCFRMALALSLGYLTVSVYVRSYSGATALIFEHLAVFFSAMAFILVITMVALPHALTIVSMAIFILSLPAVFLATYLWRKLRSGTAPP